MLALLGALVFAPTADAASTKNRYTLANGCFALKRGAGFVAKSGDGYSASAPSTAAAERFYLKATALGRYMLYGRQRDYLAGTAQNGVESASAVSRLANWSVEQAGAGTFRLRLPAAGNRGLSASGGALRLGAADVFTLVATSGCAEFPEVAISASGLPRRGTTSYTATRGLVDAHIHMMAFEFLGGRAHCGRPWHEFGVEQALVDCPDHYPANGGAAVLENVLFGGAPVRQHDPVGWPTFKDWPHHQSLTHEQTYYRWLERAWLGGLRVYVNLLVENAQLCEIYPYKQNSCDEMDSIRLQARRIRELEDYIDAQAGGPGKGFFRIVTNPFQAREVVNDGKLAVVIGIENSKLFNCGVYNDRPDPGCDRGSIDRQLDEVYKLGVRDMELVNKFDNALAGVAGDSGSTGAVVNAANRNETGKFWHMETCSDGHAHVHDKNQLTADGEDRDALVGNGFNAFAPAGTLPVYPAAPHCNTKGLTDLGEYTVRRMIEKKMIIDPDHMSVIARKQTMALIEAAKYSGVVSSHSWSTPDVIPRIYKLGGFVTPYAGDSTSFVDEWRANRQQRSKKHYFGFGYGADMNGFGVAGRAAQRQEPRHLPVQVLRRQGHPLPPAQRLARVRHQQGRRGALRPLPRLGRGPAQDRRQPDRGGHGPRLRGLPDDVGARARRAQPGLPLAPRALLAPRARPGQARPPPGGLPAPRGPALAAQGPPVPLLRAGPQDARERGLHPIRQGRPDRQQRDRPHHGGQDRPGRPRAAHPLEDQALRQVLPDPPRWAQPDRLPRAQGQDPVRRGGHPVGHQERQAAVVVSAPRRASLSRIGSHRPQSRRNSR